MKLLFPTLIAFTILASSNLAQTSERFLNPEFETFVSAGIGSLGQGDFDGDGREDLIWGGTPYQASGGLVALSLNTGTRGFAQSVSIPFATRVSALAIGDVDSDGHLDAVASEGQLVHLLLGDGLGGLALGSSITVSKFVNSVKVFDQEGDGDVDIITGLAFGDIELLTNDGTGQFASSVFTTASGIGSAIAPCDLDNDGVLDLVITDTPNGALEVLLGIATGGFSSAQSFDVNGSLGGLLSSGLVVGDLTGDGNQDVFLQGILNQTNEGYVVSGDGLGNLQAAAGFPMTAGQIQLADRHGALVSDGDLDVILFDISGLTPTLEVWENDGSGGFSLDPLTSITLPRLPLLLDDLDGDGLDDILSDPRNNGRGFFSNVVWGKSDGSFETSNYLELPASAGTWTDVHLMDLNADGNLDLFGGTPAGDVALYTGDGRANFTFNLVAANLGESLVGLEVSDFNGDCDLDLATLGINGRIQILLSDGAGGFSPSYQTTLPGILSALYWIVATDFDLDQDVDLVFEYGGQGKEIALYKNDGSGVLGGPILLQADEAGAAGVAFDFDLDGYPDVLSGNQIFPNDGLGSFGAGIFLPSSATRERADRPLVEDLDRDGLPDILTFDRVGNTTEIVQFMNLGGFQFTEIRADVNFLTEPLGIGDVNGDGVPDALFRGEFVDIGVGDGTYTESAFSYPSYTSIADRVLIGDLDQDGHAEVLTSLSTGVFIQHNLAPDLDGACQPDLGFDGPGTSVLRACGDELTAGGTTTIELFGAKPNAVVYFLASTSFQPTCFLGLSVVPVPIDFIVPVLADSAGVALIPGFPGGGGPYSLYAQAAYVDLGLAGQIGLSNAIRLDVLP